MNKICNKCKIEKDIGDFYLHKNGYRHPYCKECLIAYNRNRLKQNPYSKQNPEYFKKYFKEKYLMDEVYRGKIKKGNREYKLKNPNRIKIPYKVKSAIRMGIITKRNSCEICLNSPTVAHHQDYDKPIDVTWLCHSCHRLLHEKLKKSNLI